MAFTRAGGSTFASALAVALVSAATTATAQPAASIADAHAREGDAATTPMTFVVSLSAASPVPVSVSYSFGGLDFAAASEDTDYTAAPDVLVFEPGETTKTFAVAVIGDEIAEGDEGFVAYLGDAVGASVADGRAVGVIVDDEPAALPLGVGWGRVRVRFPILSVFDADTGTWQPGAGSVVVTAAFDYEDQWNVERDDWADYRSQWDRIRWPWGRFITSTGRAGDNTTCDPDPSGGHCGGFSEWYCEEWFEEDDDGDRGDLIRSSVSRYYEFGAYCQEDAVWCSFGFSASDSSSGRWSCWDDFDHLAYADSTVERIGAFSYNEGGYRFGPATFSDEPRVSIADAHSVAERGYVTFALTLDAKSTTRTLVQYATRDGSAVAGLDYVATTGTVVFEPGELKKTVKVAIIKDAIREEDETFQLAVADAIGAGVLRGAGTGTITDDEVFTVTAPATVVGCLPVNVKVTLPGVAPEGGVTVTLTSGNPNLVVPASLFFKAGTLAKTIKATTLAVAAREPATITAFMPGEVATDTVTLKPMGPKALALTPNPVVGGNPVTGTVTLQCAAGPGDVTVAVASSIPAVALTTSSSVVVPAGTQTAPFGVTTFPVDRVRMPTISATANGISKGKTLTVNP